MKIRTLLRNTVRAGLRAKGRFLSLFGIIAISTGFFAGLRMTSPDMKDSAEQYYRETHLMDLHLLSNVGFSAGDLDALKADPSVAQLYGAYSETAFLPVGDDAANAVVKICSVPAGMKKAGAQINQITLTEGRLPQTAQECLIEVKTPGGFQIGDPLRIEPADTEDTLLGVTEYTVVGKADWSMYVDFQRGTAQIGNGSIDCYLLVLPEAFACDFYTDVYLTFTDTAELNSFTDAYIDTVGQHADAITDRQTQLSAARAAELQAEADTQLADARAELDSGWDDFCSGKREYREKIAEGRKKLLEAAGERINGWAELRDREAEYSISYASYERSAETLAQREATVIAKETETQDAQAMLEQQRSFLDGIIGMCNAYTQTALTVPYPSDIQEMIAQAAAYDSPEYSLSQSMQAYFCAAVGSKERAELLQTITFYVENCKAALQNQFAALEQARRQLSISRQTLEAAKAELANGKKHLEEGWQQIAEAKEALKDADKAYIEGEAELEAQAADGWQTLNDAKQALLDGEQDYAKAAADAADIPAQIKWYAFTRAENPGWSSFGEDADRVAKIAAVFPVFFILVAALVCLTTMTRMVEEQRTELGTCKALGYSAAAVSVQFLLYAAGASVLGTAAGTLIGYQVFPRVIFLCYGMMYHYPPIHCPYHLGMALICLGASLLCTGLTALIACGATLREVPAMLMRPKPPKRGRRVLLEKWKWLWSKCSFHVKVTIRNFLRCRSRVLMTVLGICGCTALLVTGFGLHHAISAIVDLHYGEIFRYDCFGLYDGSEEHRETLSALLPQVSDVTAYQFGALRTGTVHAGGSSYEVNILVTENAAQLGEFITLRDRKTHAGYALDGKSVILNEKLGRLLGIQAGGSIALTNGAEPLPVTAFSENYAFNYVFMTAEQYAAQFGSYEANCFFANEQDGCDENALAETLLQSDALLRLQFTSQSGGSFRELVKALRYVVALVIVCSGLLAFVVLYNLANINILERMRELATIKVLGFYDNEVSAYIFRENILSSLCGMICGLFAGIWLCRYVVRNAEVDVVMFAPDIPWYCFALAAAVTMLFTLLVNLLLAKKLRQIDMAGSMKAIE